MKDRPHSRPGSVNATEVHLLTPVMAEGGWRSRKETILEIENIKDLRRAGIHGHGTRTFKDVGTRVEDAHVNAVEGEHPSKQRTDRSRSDHAHLRVYMLVGLCHSATFAVGGADQFDRLRAVVYEVRAGDFDGLRE